MLRGELEQIQRLIGGSVPYGPLAEAEEAEVVVERDPAEVEFLKSVRHALKNLYGKIYPTSLPAAYLTLVGVRGIPADPRTERFEFAIPLVVQYSGTAPAEVWAEADKALEAELTAIIDALAKENFDGEPRVRLLRRRKADPFKADPKSLTILRFRIS